VKSNRLRSWFVVLVSAATVFTIRQFGIKHAGISAGYTQPGPVTIHSVSPTPPYCVLRNSSYLYERLLILNGQNFSTTEHRLQFQKVSTGDLSIHFGLEVNWESPTRITVDMECIKHLLWADSKVTLSVRVTNADLEPISAWSPEFILADDVDACGIAPPTPTPVPEPVRGVTGDLWADVIIGQRDFSEFTPFEVAPYKVFNPGGVVVDRTISPGRAYVWDSGNSRILGIDLATCYANASPCSADIVIGQPSASDYSACNGDSGFQRYPNRSPASAATLCAMPEDTLSILESKSFVSMAVDQQGNLYVPDHFNHRVLKYISPFTTDTNADEVWGQVDFSANLCNQGVLSPTASSLCFQRDSYGEGSGVELDLIGNLWVVDTANNRILRFPKDVDTGVITKTADLVLGQPDFVSPSAGAALSQLNSPSALSFGPNGWLYVADTRNDRVVVFKPPFFTGMSAVSTFGSHFHDPLGLEIDLSGEGVWVYDRGNSMIELWDWDGVTVRKVLGKDIYELGHDWGSPLADGGGGFGIDAEGNILPAVYVYVQDVLRFAAPIPTPQPGVVYQPDKRLFSPPIGYNNVGNRGIRSGLGVAVFRNQLIVSDGIRLLFWNDISKLSNGKPADGVVGSLEFSYQPTCCIRIKPDSASRLWVQNAYGGIDIYQLPLKTGAIPTRVIQPNMTISVLGVGSLAIGDRIDGLVPVGQGEFLWISDTNNHRVLRIRNPLTAPMVDIILGQTNANGNECNRGLIPPPNTGTDQVAAADMLCYPGALSLDQLGNLYVSDHTLEVEGNFRLLLFAASMFPITNTSTIFAPSATKIFPYRNSQPAMTFEPAFDSTNRMVVGYNGYSNTRFVGVYDDPLGPATNPTVYLNDYGSMPFAATFDRYDNLYIADANRNRVLVYWNPFNNPLPPQIDVYLPIVVNQYVQSR